jgi:hypothetical protein
VPISRGMFRGKTALLVLALSALLALPACGLGTEVSGAQQDINAIDPAADAQAQNNLQLAVVAARTAFSDSVSFSGVNANKLSQVEPSIQYTSGASTGPSVVSVLPEDPNHWAAAVLSTSGTCFYTVIDGSGIAQNGQGKSACDAADAPRNVTQGS